MILPESGFPSFPVPFPERLHRGIAGLQRTRQVRTLQGLYLLATSGLALGLELRQALGRQLGMDPEGGSLKRLFRVDLPGLDLAACETLDFINGSRLAVLRLNPEGKALSRALNWPVVENEWERLVRQHAGLRYPQHTVGLLAFCYHARLRDWQVTLLPQVNANVEPDARVTKGSQSCYVEFEVRPHGKLEKWQKSDAFQGSVAIATFTPSLRAGLVQECRDVRVPGQATDLQTLAQAARRQAPGPLWLEAWHAGW